MPNNDEILEQRKKMLARIKRAEPDFVVYLEELDADNYRAFKNQRDPAMNQIHKGYGQAIDSLLKAVDKCDKEAPKPDPNIEQAFD